MFHFVLPIRTYITIEHVDIPGCVARLQKGNTKKPSGNSTENPLQLKSTKA